MPPTEASVPLTENGRYKMPSLVTTNGATANGTTNHNGRYRKPPAAEGEIEKPSSAYQQLNCLGKLSYHVSIAIGEFFYR